MGWGGRLFEAGRLLTVFAFRMGAYSRWALIRDWALIRINTVAAIKYEVDAVYVKSKMKFFTILSKKDVE